MVLPIYSTVSLSEVVELDDSRVTICLNNFGESGEGASRGAKGGT